MDRYDKNIKLIEDYLSRDEVIDTDEVISVYSLIQVLKEKLAPLYAIKYDKEFQKKVYQLYENNKPKNFFDFMKKKNKGCRISSYFFDNYSKIQFEFDNGENYSICKDYDSDYYYSESNTLKLDKIIVEECADEILHIFSILEEYSKFFKETDNFFNYDSNDGFCGSIRSYYSGDVFFDLYFSDGESLNNRTWYGNRENISDLLDNNREKIIRRIPLNVKSLPKAYEQAYMDSRNIKQKKYSC